MNDDEISNQQHIRSLQRFFHHKRGKLLFAFSSDEKLIAEINETIVFVNQTKKEKIRFFDFKTIDFNNDRVISSLQHFIADFPLTQGIIVMGLNAVFNTRSHILAELNFSREKLHTLDVPLLFWAAPDLLAHLQRDAKDLYDQRAFSSPFFKSHFESKEKSEIAEVKKARFAQPHLITLLEAQLDKVLHHVPRSNKMIADISIELLELYQNIHQADPINNILANYSTYFDKTDPKICGRLAQTYHYLNDHKNAAFYYQKTLKMYQTLAEANPQTYLPDLSMTLNNLANLHSHRNEYEKAEKAYEEALEIRRTLAEANPQTYLPDLSTTLNNLANLHSYRNEYEKAEKAYEEALGIRRALAEANPQTYNSYVADTLNNLANLHRDRNEYEKAEKAYEAALGIRRALAEANPQTYLPDLSMTLNNLAVLHSDRNEYEKAEKAYEAALGIYKKLAEANPQTYLPDLSMTLNNFANLHSHRNEYEKAEKAYEEALGIYKKLAEANPQTYLPDLSMTLNNFANLHSHRNEYEKAEKAYEEALGIRRTLAEANPQTYLPYVAGTLNNLAVLHRHRNEYEKAEKAYEAALGIYKKLAEANPQTYLPDVAKTLINMSSYYQESKPNREKSIQLVNEALEILLPIAEIPYIQNYLRIAFQVLKDWDVDVERK